MDYLAEKGYLHFFAKKKGYLHGLNILGIVPLLAQAYADDSLFMPKNTPQDLQLLMNTISLYRQAVGLNVNFGKSKIVSSQL